jgi:PAS domain S-box-containing protein
MALALVALGSFIIHLDLLERKRYENALRKSEYRMQSILDNSTAVISIKSIDGRYLLINQWFEKLFSRNRQQVIGRTDHEIFPKEFADEFRKNDQQVIETRKPLHLEEIAPHRDGPHTYLSIKFPLEDGGSLYGICAISTDITERKKAEDAIKRLNTNLQRQAMELESANRELEAFSYSVSHDLHAPLRAINGFSNVLINDYKNKLDPEAERLLDVIKTNAKQMSQLIDDLLAFSRLSRKSMDKRTIQMTEIARSVLDDLNIMDPGRTVSVTLDELPPAEGDPALIRQVFGNLISNAFKFSQNRTDSKVEIGSFTDNAENIYYVKDNGVGFNMDYASKLFRVFERLHRSEEFPGTGVGLAIVERIIQRHGGRVWGEGEPGHGATFYFSLPRT